MSNTLKDAADATMQTMSHLVHDAREHLEDARGHLEHLPLPHHGTPWWRSKWAIATLIGLAAVTAFTLLRRRHTDSPDVDLVPTPAERRATDRAMVA